MRRAWMVLSLLMLALPTPTLSAGPRPTGDDALPKGKFRVSVREVFKESNCLVSLIDIEVRPSDLLKILPDKPRTARAPNRVPHEHRATSKRPGDKANVKVTLAILGDQVPVQGAADVFKYKVAIRSGRTGNSSTVVEPMPAGKNLVDVMAIKIEPGVYPVGEPVLLYMIEDTAYMLTVEPDLPLPE